MKHPSVLFVLFSLAVGALGCNASRAPSGNVSASVSTASATPAAAIPSPSRVTKLVFIDKREACDCTRARVTKGWEALSAALGAKSTPTVERLYVDSEPDKVRPYREMRPMVAVPALYFLDGSGALVDQLQGEFTTQQIQSSLGSGH